MRAPVLARAERADRLVPGAPPVTRWRSVLGPADLLVVGTYGLRSRPGRSLLTAIGIGIGIAAIVAVFGISASSRADLLAQIDSLGTDLLVVEPGRTLLGEEARLPESAPAMVGRIGPVRSAAAVASLDADVRRSEHDERANGLRVLATDGSLRDTVDGTMARGRFLDEASASVPTAVLGAVAAERLGITDLRGSPAVTIAGVRFAVIGILDSLALHPDLDRSVLIGADATLAELTDELYPTRIYLRVDPDRLDGVTAVLGRTVNPDAPNEVRVSRPSDALEARARVDEGLQRLLLGLGLVALAVGGVGVANVMVISVLERRTEIGLRRALGAARRHIALQFLVESAAMTTIGGMVGTGLGAAVTAAYAVRQGWTIEVPLAVVLASVGAALLLGVVAGLYPATRAALLRPADAVRPVA